MSMADTTDRSRHRRDDFWGDEEAPAPSRGHAELPGTDRGEWIAKELLKHDATFVSPLALQEPGEYDIHDEPTTTEMSEPREWQRETEEQLLTSYGLYPRRVDEEHGYISSGKIEDRPTEEFREVVADILLAWVARDELLLAKIESFLEEAMILKRRNHLTDVDIVARLVRAREFGVQYFEDR